MNSTDDDFRTYNDDPVHNIWVDFTYDQNTGEFSYQFGENEEYDDGDFDEEDYEYDDEFDDEY